jgi:uncharacterized protein
LRLEIRDPIHGLIHRQPDEQQIIDTPVFQRLRRIKQLALATLVYPGALHTRFDHSIGTLKIAGDVARKLVEESYEQKIVRLAALLHDVGHGPFSHVSEDLLKRFSKISLRKGQQIHELIGAKIIQSDPDLARLICEQDRERIVGCLEGTWGNSVLKSIVSGPVDCDKQDYLLRDSHFCGVKYGVYDLDRLSDTLRSVDDGDDKIIALTVDGIHALEQFVLAKYYMTTQVYRHRIRLISDAMLVRGISLGIEQDKIPWLTTLYSYQDSDDYVREYLTWNDDRLTTMLLDTSAPDGYAKRMFGDLAGRRLLKRIFTARPQDFGDPAIRKFVFEAENEFLQKVEQAVGVQYQFDPKLVIANKFKLKSVRSQAATSEGEIIVLHPRGRRSFHEESTLFRSINEAIEEQYVEIYAPFAYADEREKRKRLREFESEILVLIEKLASSQLTPPARDRDGGTS